MGLHGRGKGGSNACRQPSTTRLLHLKADSLRPKVASRYTQVLSPHSTWRIVAPVARTSAPDYFNSFVKGCRKIGGVDRFVAGLHVIRILQDCSTRVAGYLGYRYVIGGRARTIRQMRCEGWSGILLSQITFRFRSLLLAWNCSRR